ncbi:MAG: MFS transporter, partial [Verrucomicrobiae bacterium]|nr:MFS transporter [Verrucomicrobiae bacterium]
MSPVWGWVFDRVNFFALRVVLNLGFALGILTFFTSDTMTGLVTGAVLFGVAMAGGDVAWTLWVTKIAPPDRVAEYMSVHTFFTGLRGMAAPVAVFHLVMHLSVATVSAISAALIVLATLILLREVRGQTARD